MVGERSFTVKYSCVYCTLRNKHNHCVNVCYTRWVMGKRYLTILLFVSVACNIYLLDTLRTERARETASRMTVPSTLTDGASYTLLRIVDGDTITVGWNDTVEYVRLIGINAPETNDPGGPECFGREATGHLRDLLTSGVVVLRFDPSQGARDVYNRVLAYVELPDGRDAGMAMLEDGYAREYTYAQPYARRDVYLAKERDAAYARRGLWGEGVCK